MAVVAAISLSENKKTAAALITSVETWKVEETSEKFTSHTTISTS